MQQFRTNNKLFYQFDQLKSDKFLHFTTTKVGWGGNGKSRFTGDSKAIYQEYRQELATSLRLSPEQLVFPRQTHTDHIAVVTEPLIGAEIPDTDALITNVPGLCICVQTADCVPILICDPVKKIVAAIHAGWRGTVSLITLKTATQMIQEFGCDPNDLIAGIGPSISRPNYEVSTEVIDAVKANFTNHQDLLFPNGNAGKADLNLWKANQTLLENAGIPLSQIEIMGLCSFNGENEFYSARRDGAATGRMVTGIMIL